MSLGSGHPRFGPPREPSTCAAAVLFALCLSCADAAETPRPPGPNAVQHDDTGAIGKRFQDFYAAGNYSAALGEAQKFEAVIKARVGIDHPDYASALNNLARVHKAQGNYREAEDLFGRALAIRERSLGEYHADVGSILTNLGDTYRYEGKYGEAEALLKRALVIREQALGKDDPDVADTLNDLAQVYVRQAKYGEAESLHRRALAIRERALGEVDPAVALSLDNLAGVRRSQGRYGEAEEFYKRALAIREKKLGDSHPDVAATLNGLGDLYRYEGKYGEAEALLKRALAIREQAFGKNNTNVATTLTNLGDTYRYEGKYGEAEPLLKRALAIGKDNPNVTTTMNDLALVYAAQAKYAEADSLFRRAIAIREKNLGESHPDVASILNNLGDMYRHEGKYEEAETLFRRALTIREQALGKDNPSVAATLTGLGDTYRHEGKYDEAEVLLERASAINEQAFGKNKLNLTGTMNDLALVYSSQAKYREAEALHKQVLAIRERALGVSHPSVALSLDNLAGLYRSQGRYGDAEGLLKRALAIREKNLGANHPDVAATLTSLGDTYRYEAKYGEAEALLKRALAIREQVFGKDNPNVTNTLNDLALVYSSQSKFREAEGLHKRALAIGEKTLGTADPAVALSLDNLAGVYRSQGKYGEAEGLYKRALTIGERALGASHPAVAVTLNNLAGIYGALGKNESALTFSRRATALVVAHAAAESFDARLKADSDGLVERRSSFFRRHLANLAAAARTAPDPSLGREALETAQWASRSSAAAAVGQMSTRFAAGDGALAATVREIQDLSAARREKDNRLLDELANPEGQRDGTAIEVLRTSIAENESRIAVLAGRLETEFPEYAALANPRSLKATEVQKLLAPDEALVFLLTGDKESYVFALSDETFVWRAIPLGASYISSKVAAVRRNLDVDALLRSASAGKPELFDLRQAYDLYVALFGGVDELIKHKAHLIIVPTGPLTALPFQLLVTAPPVVATPRLEDIATYRNVAWIIKRQAVSVLPSISSLEGLRVFARAGQGVKPMIGFGDPIFDPTERARAVAVRERQARPTTRGRPRAARPYGDFWQGGGADRAQLANSLPSLLDTADELKAVADRLGAPSTDIHLENDASEATVKRSQLSDYRIVYFATHGLVAGDIEGLGEPSLALTLPAQPNEFDDGLLTASEVAQLKLNADWVVLSACNTIAGEKPGAEALSGLARAFFYAGARALLVSHWSVASEAATRLTISTFEFIKNNPKLGRAEALRRAMLDYMNDTTDPVSAYPAFWGPFAVVGEGGHAR
jgi:tetratricopeptide (TPR) repeat protein/CHAT domain-containing protein